MRITAGSKKGRGVLTNPHLSVVISNSEQDPSSRNTLAYVLMLEYVPKVLVRFQHKAPQTSQHQLYPHIKTAHRTTHQYAETSDMSAPLYKEEHTQVQEVIGSFLYYA